MNYVVVIPARLKSSRFPRKPLALIDGIPMIVRTCFQALSEVPRSLLYVATDSTEVANVCMEYEIQTIMTSQNCLTGTDRVAEVSLSVDADVYINLQGDEPIFAPADIANFLKYVSQSESDVCTGYTEITRESDFYSLKVPKFVISENDRLMYASRSPIPGSKDPGFSWGYRQVCIYSFTKKALTHFRGRAKKTACESQEDIEILRFLELGVGVDCVKLSDKSVPVDYPEDVFEVERILRGDIHA